MSVTVCVHARERESEIKQTKKKKMETEFPVAGIFMRAALYPVCVGYFTNGVVGRELDKISRAQERVKEKERGFD